MGDINNMNITFCTSCMGYTKYLKQTYLKNIEVAKNDKYDFILVNYNSKDDMNEWVMKNLKTHIDSGKVKYYKTGEPEYWNMSHAKNVAHKLAEGDYLCNLDADNYLTKEFLEWVDELIRKDEPFITQGRINGNGGRVIIKKEDFYETNGYDEINDALGDHQELVSRIERMSRTVYVIPNKDCPAINQTDVEREKNLLHSLEESRNILAGRLNKNTNKTKSEQNEFGVITKWIK